MSDVLLEKIKKEPIQNIVDGWSLEDGSLYLFVQCSDGIIRTISLNKKNKND